MFEFEELRALIVYENRRMSQIIATVLKPLGLRDVHYVERCEDALALVRDLEPDVLIQDVVVGEADGLDLVRVLRDKRVSPNPYLPIIVASGHTQRKYVHAAIEAGAHEFVTFPLSAETLARRLYSAVFIGRPFIDEAGYFGPDRRRRAEPDHAGPERRADAEGAAAQIEARSAAEARFADRLAAKRAG